VRRFATLVGLALRELWLSYRLLVGIAVLVAAALPVALLPELPTLTLGGAPLHATAWFAAGLAGALALLAAIAAGTLAGERRRGTLAWLAVRAVPRTTLLLAWFAAFSLVLVLGLVASAALAAATLGSALIADRPTAFWAVTAAVAAAGLAAMAFGLLVGTLLRPVAAVVVTLLLVGGVLLAAVLGPPTWSPLPAAGLAVLAGFGDAARPIADAARSSGTALALAAGLLLLAAARLERVDL
jgi:ABC-type transport system involved in multi-copper enzyme maturation permease subunit